MTQTPPKAVLHQPSATSWWFDEALRFEARASSNGGVSPVDIKPVVLDRDLDVDVAIVGGGFTGLWTAIILASQSPQLRIALIEAGLCGSGASGKNGGKVHGYWAQLPALSGSLGYEKALAMAQAGTRAQDAIRAYAQQAPLDIQWREGGNIRVSASPSQDAKLASYVRLAHENGIPDSAQAMTKAELDNICNSSAFRGGVFFREGAAVQPARLARALRLSAIRLGVQIFENTSMQSWTSGSPCRVQTAKHQITARKVVLATNVALGKEASIQPWMTVFSSYAAMSEPTEALRAMNWTGEAGFADARMFLHYFRKTDDQRVLMGSGSGPVAFNNNWQAPPMTMDRVAAGRAVTAMTALLPAMKGTGIAKSWGGAIDISSDRLPRAGSLDGRHVFYAAGYCGHGVNPTFIAGQCLAEAVLEQKHEWRNLPIWEREMLSFPPEPFRTIGARMIRRAILRCEDADGLGQRPKAVDMFVASLPERLGIRVGTR